jgi:hypothetical protein
MSAAATSMREGQAGAVVNAGFSILSDRRFAQWCQMRQWAHRWSLFEKTADELTKEPTMNVSWSDLNNVQEAGDYSFRDGTISVTFVEVAIWKNNPSAQFQLMRKNLTQTTPGYLLGKQIKGELPLDEASLIYQSSSGDSWFLTRSSNGRLRRDAHSQPAIWRPSIVRRNRKIPLRRRERAGTPGAKALDRNERPHGHHTYRL